MPTSLHVVPRKFGAGTSGTSEECNPRKRANLAGLRKRLARMCSARKILLNTERQIVSCLIWRLWIVNMNIFDHYSHVNVSPYVAGDSRINNMFYLDRTMRFELRNVLWDPESFPLVFLTWFNNSVEYHLSFFYVKALGWFYLSIGFIYAIDQICRHGGARSLRPYWVAPT